MMCSRAWSALRSRSARGPSQHHPARTWRTCVKSPAAVSASLCGDLGLAHERQPADPGSTLHPSFPVPAHEARAREVGMPRRVYSELTCWRRCLRACCWAFVIGGLQRTP
eukprot:2571465-Prymnesium_polylepis.1